MSEGFDGDEEALLGLAGVVEADSEHPLARAIVAAGEKGGVLTADNFRSLTGRGVEAEVDGSAVAVGGPSLLRERGLEVRAGLVETVDGWKARGATVLHVIRDGRIAGALALEDEIRPESREAVKALHEQGSGWS